LASRPIRVAVVGSRAMLGRYLAARRPLYADLLAYQPPVDAIGEGEADLYLLQANRPADLIAGLPALLAPESARAALTRRAALLLDGSGEGPPFAPEIAAALHRILADSGVPARRVIHATQNELHEAGYVAWAREAGIAERMIVVVQHYHLLEVADAMRREQRHGGRRVARLRAALTPGTGRARFLCLNNRLHPHRVVMLGRLARIGALERSLVSAAAATKEQQGADFAGLIAEARQALPDFAADIEAFAGLPLPLAIPGDPGGNVVTDLSPRLYDRALFSLVGETTMNIQGGPSARFTEKTAKALANGHAALVAGPLGVLRLLRSHGFESFAPFLDESYDVIADPAARLGALLAEMERLAALDETQVLRLRAALLPAVEHNLRHFAEGLPRLLERRLEHLARVVEAILRS